MATMTLCKQDLEIVKTRTIFLKVGQISNEIVLSDPSGDMYFTVLLQYLNTDGVGKTHIDIKDDYHAQFTIETRPHSITKIDCPYKIGTYLNKELLFDFVVSPVGADNTHNVTLTFYAR